MQPVQKFYLEKNKDNTWQSDLPYNKLLQALKTIPKGRWLVTIERYFPQRTSSQNRFYFGNFIPAQIECFEENWGETYSKEQMHDFNKLYFFGTEKAIEETGEIIKIPESSTKQTTVSWEVKLEKARQWFRQSFNWELPMPNEQLEIDTK